MKRKTFAGAIVVMALSFLIYGTNAYFTAEDTSHNLITSGNINIELLEWADEDRTVPFPKEAVEGVMPGTDVTKIIEVENTGSNPAFIRVKVEKDIELAQGTMGEPDLGLIQLDFDNERWALGEDGYYYYNEALAVNDKTEPLFTKVTFEKSMGNLYQNSRAVVDVKAYAVQTANNGLNVFDATGWPVE